MASSRPPGRCVARRVAFGTSAVVLAAVSLAPARRSEPPSACEAAIAAGDWPGARGACREAYERDGDPEDLADLAYAYLVSGEVEQAATTAHGLLGGALDGQGHLLLCQAMYQQGRGRAAFSHGLDAFAAHAMFHQRRLMARDALCMSQSAWQYGDFEAALAAAEQTVRLAAGNERPIEVQGHVARIDALRRIGAWREAQEAVDEALARATTPCDQAWLHLKGGMLLEESDQASLAPREYDLALHANERCGSNEIAESVDLNRAWLLVREHPDRAAEILDRYRAAPDAGFEVRLMQAVLAANRGDRPAAERLLEEAGQLEPPDEDWRWELERTRAELAASAGDAAGNLAAERAYRRAIALIAPLRATSQQRSALLLASHHAPYGGLILLLARQGRWLEALAVVMELDASDMLRSATAGDGRPAPAPLSIERVVGAWRGRDLVVVLAPTRRLIAREPEPVIRIRIADGEVAGEVFGSAEEARAAARALFADPDHAGAARTLGDVVIPTDPRTDALDVLAIGSLGKVPLAALRDASGSLVIARRPLGQVLSLLPLASAPSSSDRAVVLADPLGDLASARFEGRLVAALLGERALLAGAGARPAIRARLEDARHAGVLHVAAHVADRGRWRVLRLEDRDVDPVELVALGIAPRLAVLASCGSGAAHDDEGWGSLAAALIAAGTGAVIATDRSVGDFAALRLVMRFYAQPDWAEDPARALARVQVAEARQGIAAAEWAAFGVLRAPPSLPR